MARLRRVRQTDGHDVPFSQARIARSIHEAVLASGVEDGVLAEELAGVVTLFLEKHYDDETPPKTVDIRDMVRKVLLETGHSRIAQAYWELRSGTKRIVDVVHPVSIEVMSRSRHLIEPWDRQRLERFLCDELELDENDASDVAAAIESRLSATGIGRVTSTLVRELVDIELAMRGVEGALSKRRSFAIDRRDIEALLAGTSGSEADPEQACAARLFEPWMLDEVHSQSVVRAHLDGRLHLLGLGAPQRVESVSIDATGPAFGAVADLDDLLLHVVMLLQSVRPLARRQIVLGNFSEAIARLPKRPGRTRVRLFVERLVDHLLRLDVFGRAMLPKLVLEVHLTGDHLGDIGGEEERHVVDLLATALLDALNERRKLLGRLGLVFALNFEDPASIPESKLLDAVLSAARRHGDVGIEVTRRTVDPSERSSPRRRDGVVMEVGAVVLNLPMILAQASDDAVTDVRGILAPAVHLAVDALLERYWYLRRSAPQSIRGVLEYLPGGERLHVDGAEQGGQILLWGLPYCLAMLAPQADPKLRAEALARVLGCIDFLLGEPSENVRLAVTLGGVSDRVVRERLLTETSRFALERHHERLGAALAEVSETVAVLPLVPPLFAPANRAVLHGRFLARFGPGLPLPTRGPDEIVGAAWLKHLLEHTSLHYFELEERPTVFEQQPDLFG